MIQKSSAAKSLIRPLRKTLEWTIITLFENFLQEKKPKLKFFVVLSYFDTMTRSRRYESSTNFGLILIVLFCYWTPNIENSKQNWTAAYIK